MKALGNFISAALSYLLFSFLLLLSLLPFFVHYLLSDVLAFLLYHVFQYRRKVVYKNLEGSLPEGTDTIKVAKNFYRFLADTVHESIKCLTISKTNLLKRMTCDNPEIMENYARQNRSVILMSGHYCNWEYLIYAMNLLFPHLAIGVGKPLTNKVMNKLLNAKRSKTGMKIINAKNIKEEFQNDKDILTASLFLSDQFPGGANKGFPSIFLNKETEFMFGAEKYAVDYDSPVVYADMQRIKRGRYNAHLIVLADRPKELPYGEIMNKYIRCIENTILREPQYWLWSHKRWKQLKDFYK
jgi:Kdo2-lipid IVA lauroyltransferase/acyltransferase